MNAAAELRQLEKKYQALVHAGLSEDEYIVMPAQTQIWEGKTYAMPPPVPIQVRIYRAYFDARSFASSEVQTALRKMRPVAR